MDVFFAHKPVIIPAPPNGTGRLHNILASMQNVLVRKKSTGMEGQVVCGGGRVWSTSFIATEAKQKVLPCSTGSWLWCLRETGISQKDLTRKAFLQQAWAWKENYMAAYFWGNTMEATRGFL